MSVRHGTGVVLAVAWRNLYTTAKTPSLALPPLMIPLFTLAMLGGGLSGLTQVPNFDFRGNYTAFTFVFVLLQASTMCGVFSAVALARDFETGFARRLMIAAPRRWHIVVSSVLAALGRAAVTIPLLFGFGLVFGMTVGGTVAQIVSLVCLAAVVTFLSALWATGLALRLRTTQATPAMTLPVFAGLFAAPAFVPLAALTGWSHTVASLNPLTPFVESMRGFLSGEPSYVRPAVLTSLVLTLLLGLWAVTGLRKAEAAGG